jgi:xylan 1,4-beta-xylosidase
MLMQEYFETINHLYDLPFSLFIFDGQFYHKHWHKEVELMLVLNGSANIDVNGQSRKLQDGDILIINSYELHEVVNIEKGALLLILQLNPLFFAGYYPKFPTLHFESQLLLLNHQQVLCEDLKKDMLELFYIINGKKETFRLQALRVTIILAEKLIALFRDGQKEEVESSPDRLQRILSYIHNHYNEKISLTTLANTESISPYYLSKFFKKEMGMNFNQYITAVRLSKAMWNLLHSDKRIEDIAKKHGFSTSKSYITSFKSLYRLTPHQFRKNHNPENYLPINKNYPIQKSILEYMDEQVYLLLKKHI